MNRWPYPRHIAHRGGAHLAPENTLPAFAEAARRGYRCVECDVALTADGVPVLLHDDSVERTTDGHGRLSDLSAAALSRFDAGSWFHPRFAGTRVPTLEQAIGCWHGHGQQALIELKLGKAQDPERLGAIVASSTLRYWRGDPPLFISFSTAALAAAARVAPLIPRAVLLDEPWPGDWHAALTAAQACALDIEHTLVTRERIDTVHDAGCSILTWTVNGRARAQELLDLGVDAITTDAIDQITPDPVSVL
jgi:glycerophosphoryl diester phosphodiesterase